MLRTRRAAKPRLSEKPLKGIHIQRRGFSRLRLPAILSKEAVEFISRTPRAIQGKPNSARFRIGNQTVYARRERIQGRDLIAVFIHQGSVQDLVYNPKTRRLVGIRTSVYDDIIPVEPKH